MLEDLGYLREFRLLPKGELLARIYGEGDVLVAEAIADGVLKGLSPAEAAAIVSPVVYESRERMRQRGEMPTGEAVSRYRRLVSLYRRIRRAEDAHGVELCRELEPGFATAVFHWAEGKPLADVLGETGLAAGDFVRNCKQLADLLRQIEEVAPEEEARLAREAREAVNRGVVAYTGI